MTDLGGSSGAQRAIVAWSADELPSVLELWAAMPGEPLLIDDLDGIVMEPGSTRCRIDAASDLELELGPTHIWATDDGTGFVIVSERHLDGFRQGHVQLLAVHPDVQRQGVGRALLHHVMSWAQAEQINAIQVGGAAPFYLYTGVDSTWLAAQCFFEKLGFQRTMIEFDLFCPTRITTRPGVSPPTTMSHVRSSADVVDLTTFAEREYPHWIPEYLRGVEAGCVVIARDEEGAVVGAGAHSVNRFGVLGPIGVAKSVQRGGVGVALMAELLADLSIAGLDRAEIAWTSTVRFYERACQAWVGRSVQFYSLTVENP